MNSPASGLFRPLRLSQRLTSARARHVRCLLIDPRLQQQGDGSTPTGLMGSPYPATGIAILVFVEKYEVL